MNFEDTTLTINKILSNSFFIRSVIIFVFFFVTLFVVNLLKFFIENKVEDPKLRYKSKKNAWDFLCYSFLNFFNNKFL